MSQPQQAAVRRRLLALLRRELAAPGRLVELAGPLCEPGGPPQAWVAEWLAAKEEQARAAWYVEAAPLWLRQFTWRLIRPLLVLGVAAAVLFSLQDAVDPTLGLGLFLLGAASLYVCQQFFAHLWARRDARQLAAAEERYRLRLRDLIARAERSRSGFADPEEWRHEEEP